MASIDKTFTDSYKDYKRFKNWADKQTVTFFDGHQECIGDWVYELEEENFALPPADGDVEVLWFALREDESLRVVVVVEDPAAAVVACEF